MVLWVSCPVVIYSQSGGLFLARGKVHTHLNAPVWVWADVYIDVPIRNDISGPTGGLNFLFPSRKFYAILISETR